MFRRSTVILTASLALLSTLDSATCFAAAAPAQQRDDLERPRFLKKEIKRFVFSNTTTSGGGPLGEASTSSLEALNDALTSSTAQDLAVETTPVSITPTITPTPSVTASEQAQSSFSDVSQSSADRDREAFVALQESPKTTPISSAPLPPSFTSGAEGVLTQSSNVPGDNLGQATGSIQSSPSSSISHPDQVSGEETAPQTTYSSAVGRPGDGATSSQSGSNAQPEISASPSSAPLPVSSENPQAFDIAHQTSGSSASGIVVSNAEGQGPSTAGSQAPPNTVQQTDTQVQSDNTQRSDAVQSRLSSEALEVPPVTTSIAGSSSPALTAGLGKTSVPNTEASGLEVIASPSTGGQGIPPVTTAGAGSPTSAAPIDTTIASGANNGAITAPTGNTLAAISVGGSLAVAPGDTVQSSIGDIGHSSYPGGEVTSEVPGPNTRTGNEGPANTNTNVNSVVPTTLGNGAGAATTTLVAQPASSPVAPQSVTVPATGVSVGHETSPVTTGFDDTQPTSSPGAAVGATSQNGGPLGPSPSTALQPNPVQSNSQVGGSLPQTTLADGAVVPNSAQITGTVKATAASLEIPEVSASYQISNLNPNAGATTAASVLNPSLAAAASKLNAIPASIENPLASVSGNPPSIFNPALTAAASVVNGLPLSVHNPEHANSAAGSPPSASPAVVGGSSPPGGGSQITAGATGSPVTAGSQIGGSASLVGGTASPATGTGSPGGTQSPVAATGSLVGGTVSPGVGTQSPVGATGAQSGVTGSPLTTGSPVGGTGSSEPVVGATGSPLKGTDLPASSGSLVGGTGSPVVGSGSPAATGSPTGATGLQVGGTESPTASGQIAPGQFSQGSENTAQASGVPGFGPTTASNGDIINGTPAPTHQSVAAVSGIAGYSTQSNGQVVPISAAHGTGSLVSNGQIVPRPTGQEASAQSLGPNETGAASASNAVQSASAAAVAAIVATQNNPPPPGPTATPVMNAHQQYTGKGPFTQAPVGYDTSTTKSVPTSILHGPTSTPSATQGGSFGPSNLPSNVPQILYQNGGPGPQPPNTALIYMAFRYELNYLFVYNHTVSQEQIFHYIPLGISYGLEIDVSLITMQSLRAWDTYQDIGWVTCLSLAWVPEGLVDSLKLLVSTSVSRFYNNPDNSTAFLLSMINSGIPITGSNNPDGASVPLGSIPSDSTSAKTNGAPIGGDIGNSEHVRASSVGIGVGVACGAAAYGAAMFFVARRYKKRRQSHLRSPSMFSSPVMSHAGPDAGAGAALMSGGMGERSASPYYDNDGRAGSRGSGRSGSSRHQISAPVMAENSLGWN